MAESRSIATEVYALAGLLAGATLKRGAGLHPHVAGRVFNAPLAIAPTKLQAIFAGIGERLGLSGIDVAARGVIRQDRSRDYQVLEGIGVVPIMGTIVKRNSYGALESSGLVSTEAAQETILAALRDPNCSAILLELDSYGGEVAGTADLADFIYANRGEKPIWCIANENAFSAGCWIGTAADRCFVTQNGGWGSVGVVAIHVDESAADEAAGFRVTLVFAGDQKVDLSPFAPLTNRGRETLQAEVNRVYGLFVAAVARNRKMSTAAVQATEAGCFQGQNAVDAGFADAVSTFDDVLLELAAEVNGAGLGSRQGGRTMSKEAGTGAAAAGDGKTGADVVSMEERRKERQAGEAAGTEAERKRVQGIKETMQLSRLGKDEARTLADECIEGGLSVDEARKRFLEVQAKAQSTVETKPDLRSGAGSGSAGHVPQPMSRLDVIKKREAVMAGARTPFREPGADRGGAR